MDTLILAQNAADLTGQDLIRSPGLNDLQVGNNPLRYKLAVFHVSPDPVSDTQGGTLLGSAPQIVRTIVGFADLLLTIRQMDRVDFQVIFMFHQSSRKTVATLDRALRQLPNNPDWKRLPFSHNKHLRVPRVWMLSCESATDQVTQDGRLLRYIAQSSMLRTMAQKGFITPQSPPPNNPPGDYHPTLYTFSTGDPVTGAITMNPADARFRRLRYRLVQQGTYPGTTAPRWDFEEIPHDPASGLTEAQWHNGEECAGKVYKHTEGQPTEEVDIPANGAVNLLGDAPP